MVKRVLAIAFAIMITTSFTVAAEQSSAEHYRQIFRSGNFCVKYRMSAGTMGSKYYSIITLASKDGKRMQRKTSEDDKTFANRFSGISDRYLDGTDVLIIYAGFNPNERTENLFTNAEKVDEIEVRKNQSDKDKDWCDVLYKNGKYYRFGIGAVHSSGAFGLIGGANGGKVKVLNAKVLDEKYINSSFLNPNEEWEFIRSDLALPDELAIFYWDEPMRDNLLNLPAPTFTESSERNIGKKKYNCDTYVRDIKNLAGEVIAQNIYDMLYFDGKLELIQTYFLRGERKTLIRKIEVKNITAEVSDDLFTINKKVNVYAAEIGDINDLIDSPVLVETWGEKK